MTRAYAWNAQTENHSVPSSSDGNSQSKGVTESNGEGSFTHPSIQENPPSQISENPEGGSDEKSDAVTANAITTVSESDDA